MELEVSSFWPGAARELVRVLCCSGSSCHCGAGAGLPHRFNSYIAKNPASFQTNEGGGNTFCSLPGCADGEYPLYIVRTAQGNFYGSTEYGGNGQGVIFEVSSTGAEPTLYTFCPGGVGSGCPDGSGPTRLLASGGELYGTTAGGGNGGAGLIYQLTTSGVESVLYSFPANYSEDATPVGVIMDSSGNLYGTALNGASGNVGVVFELAKN